MDPRTGDVQVLTEDEFAALSSRERERLVALTEAQAKSMPANRAERRRLARMLRKRGRGYTK